MTTTTMAPNGVLGESAQIRLQYPRNQRLLLGSVNGNSPPGFQKAMEAGYPVEVSVECQGLIGGRLGLLGRRARFPLDLRPFVVFFFRVDNPNIASNGGGLGGNDTGSAAAAWQLIARSETVVCDEYVRFVAKMKLSCASPAERAREVRIELFNQLTPSGYLKDQQFLGAVESTLEAVTSEKLFRRELPVQTSRDLESCTMALSADIIRPSLAPSRVTLNVDFSSITKGTARCFYVISRQLPSGDFTPVYRSEVLDHHQKRFQSMSRLVDALTGGVDMKLLRLELYQVVSKRSPCMKLGFMQTSLSKLKNMEANSSFSWWPAPNETGYPDFVDVQRIVLLSSRVEDDHSYFVVRVTT